MLRITVEIVPFGVEKNKSVIRRMEIANDGSGTLDEGSYYVKSFVTNGRDDRRSSRRPSRIRHTRSKGFWPLIARCLAELGVEA